MTIEPQGSKGVTSGHVAGIVAVAVIGGVLAMALFFWIVGAVFRVVEILVVILIVGLLVRWLVLKALR